MLAAAGSFAREQRRGDRLRRGERGRLVRNDRAHHPRPAGVAVRLNRGETRKRLDHRIVNALVRIRSGLAEAADRHVDDVVAQSPNDAFAETHPFDRAGTEVLHEHVGARNQALQRRHARRALQVEHERAFAAIGRNETRRQAGRDSDPRLRTRSPPGGSTLMTSAPWSPSIIVATGPEIMLVRSRTRTPSSGPSGSRSRVPLMTPVRSSSSAVALAHL